MGGEAAAGALRINAVPGGTRPVQLALAERFGVVVRGLPRLSQNETIYRATVSQTSSTSSPFVM